MDEKTEELRDLFLDVAEDTTVTESQQDDRGSLGTDRDVEGELREVIVEMRDRYEFDTDLDDASLVELVTAFYDGATDAVIAQRLGIKKAAIRRARYDLHLVREREREAPFDLVAAVRAVDDGASVSELADRFDVEEETIRQRLRVHDIEQRSRLANQRFRAEFDNILGDAELSMQLVRDVHEDGLEDATEGLETNVSF